MGPLIRFAAVLVALSGTRSVSAQQFVLDPARSTVVFGVKHYGYSFLYGRFNRVQGSFRLDPDPRKCEFHLTVDAASIDANDAELDARLRGKEFLQTDQFPLINFQSVTVVPSPTDQGMTYRVAGELTMHGVTQPVEIVLRKVGEGPGPDGADFRVGFHGQRSLLRSGYGMTALQPEIGDELALTISFVGVRQPEASAARPDASAP